MVNGLCPPLFQALLPDTNSAGHNYMLRNATLRQLPRTRTNIFAGSYIPSTTRLWNGLPQNARNANCISTFKSYIKQMLFPARLDHLRHGPRKLNICDEK